MIHRTFWSIIAVALACSTATAADIRRVVTGLDANNKAIALFDSRLTLNPAIRHPSSEPVDHGFLAARILVQG